VPSGGAGGLRRRLDFPPDGDNRITTCAPIIGFAAEIVVSRHAAEMWAPAMLQQDPEQIVVGHRNCHCFHGIEMVGCSS
jgi:hypothetical protein